MPLFDFACRGCGHVFEDLITNAEAAAPTAVAIACPKCGDTETERQLGRFSVPRSTGAREIPDMPSCGRCGENRPPCGN
jgi:putative FmdB family regulatory protein